MSGSLALPYRLRVAERQPICLSKTREANAHRTIASEPWNLALMGRLALARSFVGDRMKHTGDRNQGDVRIGADFWSCSFVGSVSVDRQGPVTDACLARSNCCTIMAGFPEITEYAG
jgi:hypothetical protein